MGVMWEDVASMRRRLLYPIAAVMLVVLFFMLGGDTYPASRATSLHKRPPLAGLAHAYGFIRLPCSGCGPPFRHATPLVREQSKNISLGVPSHGAPEGTWCFVVGGGISPSTAAVVASAVGEEGTLGPHSKLPQIAEWVPSAYNCPANELEIQTFIYILEGSSLVVRHEGGTSFSFVVLDREGG
jgi:hypothetical protein